MIVKKISAVLGAFVGFILVTGTLFKIQHYPGASVMMILGLTLFAAFFIPLYFVGRVIEEKLTIAKIAHIVAIFTLSTLTIGLLFKIQHYPGASLMLILGSLGFTFISSPLYVIAGFKSKTSLNSFLYLLFAIVFVSSWLLTLGFFKFTHDVVSNVVFIDEELIKSTEIMRAENDQYYYSVDSLELSHEDKNLLKHLTGIRLELSNIIKMYQKDMINYSGGYLDMSPERDEFSHEAVAGLKNSDIPSMQMIMENKVELLFTKLQDFQTSYEQFNSRFELPKESVVELFPTSHKSRRWGVQYFDHSPVFIALPTLTAIETRAMRMEREVMTRLK